jgi:hypothetical protein
MDSEPELQVIYLGVTRPVPRAMYLKHGWQPYNEAPNTCIMRRFKNNKIDPAFDQIYFTGQGPYRVRIGKRSDLSNLEALYNLMIPAASFGRNYLYDLYRGIAVEGQIDAMFNDVDQKIASVVVLEDVHEKIMGVSFSRQGHFHLKHTVEWDYYVAPFVWSEAKSLMRYTLDQPLLKGGLCLCTAQASCDACKNDLLQTFGFQETGRMINFYTEGDMKYDRIIFQNNK